MVADQQGKAKTKTGIRHGWKNILRIEPKRTRHSPKNYFLNNTHRSMIKIGITSSKLTLQRNLKRVIICIFKEDLGS
jgi:hypothetical protein